MYFDLDLKPKGPHPPFIKLTKLDITITIHDQANNKSGLALVGWWNINHDTHTHYSFKPTGWTLSISPFFLSSKFRHASWIHPSAEGCMDSKISIVLSTCWWPWLLDTPYVQVCGIKSGNWMKDETFFFLGGIRIFGHGNLRYPPPKLPPPRNKALLRDY